METLLEALTLYAEENLIPRLVRENTPQIGDARLQAEQQASALGDLHPKAEAYVKKLEDKLGDVYSCRERAFLLAGVSIGLELGRL